MIYFALSFLISYGILVTFRLNDACKEINDQMEAIHNLSIRNQELVLNSINTKHYPDETRTDTLTVMSGIMQRYIDNNTNDLISFHNTRDELLYLLHKVSEIKKFKKL